MWTDEIKVDKSWDKFLNTDIRSELIRIESQIKDNYTPESNKVLRFMELDLNKIKVVILGQDPYKPAGVATGRSFEPADLYSWSDKFRQVSLKNIVRLIYKSINNIENYSDIPSYKAIVSEIITGDFTLKEPKEWFDSLERQGVLFLNTTLTCKIGVSNSHKKVWEDFSKKLLNYINTQNKDLYWFLWGKEAISNKEFIKNGKIYTSNHPMMCSEKYEDDFLKGSCFKDTMDIINWLG